MLGRGDEVVLELATLSMGALAAGAISSTSPLHALLVLPPLVVLHRAVLVRHFQEVASIDGKTGLLNAAAWQDQADRVLQRAQRSQGGAAVLILDLDHFKRQRPPRPPGRRPASSRPWPRRCAPRCATTTSSAGSAARSS